MRLPLTARVVADARRVPTWLVTLEGGDAFRRDAFRACRVELVEVPAGPGEGVDLAAALRALGTRGLTRILVEGGAMLAASLLREDLVDRLVWARAASIIGGDGIPAVAPFGLDTLAHAPRFARRRVFAAGDDIIEEFGRS